MTSCVGKVAHIPQSGNAQSELHREPLWFFSRSKNPEWRRSSNTIFVQQMQKPNCCFWAIQTYQGSHLCITAGISMATCAATSFSVWLHSTMTFLRAPSALLHQYLPTSGIPETFLFPEAQQESFSGHSLTTCLFSSRCEWVWDTWHLWAWHLLQYCWELHLHLPSWLHASQWRKQLHGYVLGFL